MAEPLEERPALAAAAGSSAGTGPAVVERTDRCLIQVVARRGQEAATARALGLELPSRPNSTGTDGDIVTFCLRPRDWLIVTADPAGRRGGVAVEARKRLQGIAAAIDQSHGRVVLELAGSGSRALLQQGCNLDLDPAVFQQGGMAQTGIAGIVVLLHCTGEDRFDLYVARSYTPALVTWLARHGARVAKTARG